MSSTEELTDQVNRQASKVQSLEKSMALMMSAMVKQNEAIDRQNQFITYVEKLLSPEEPLIITNSKASN